MNSLDGILLALVFFSALLGLWRGVVREVLSLLAWVFGIVLAGRFAADLAPRMPFNGELLAYACAWVLILVLVLLIVGLLARLLKQLLSVAGLGLVDRLLGAGFGFLRGTLLLLVLVQLIGMSAFTRYPVWTSSQVVPLVHQLLEFLKPVLPAPFERWVS